MQPHIDGDKMPPRSQTSVPPRPKDAGAERQGARLEEREETTAEAGAVDVHEVTVLPMVLEVGGGRETEFGVLGCTVVVPGAGDAVDDRNVEREVEGGYWVGGEVVIAEFSGEGGVGEEDGESGGLGVEG